jgi:hypothetical protein
MIKRILILGIAALALALVAPVIGGGANVAHAQTDPTAEAPDSGDTDAPDSGDTSDTPDQGDSSDDQGDSSGCADGARAHASGEDCTPAPGQPAPVQPAPTNQPPESQKKESGGSSSESAGESVSQQVSPQLVQATTPVSAGVDTGTIPQGGIQAGAGGTADEGSQAGLLWGGALMLAFAASGLALRRRSGLES